MKNASRPSWAVLTILLASTLLLAGCATPKAPEDGAFVHHVFFWLKDGGNPQVQRQFEAGLQELVTIENIASYKLGKPANTPRNVVDNSYDYSLLLIFADKEQQDIYQEHPAHKKFIDENEELWQRVQVYDSVDY